MKDKKRPLPEAIAELEKEIILEVKRHYNGQVFSNTTLVGLVAQLVILEKDAEAEKANAKVAKKK